MILKIQKNKGFTMVETLVAIFILLISITGPLAVAQGGLKAAFIARDQTVAYYLAQDAIEFIKNKRDDNFINIRDWLDGLDNCLGSNICTVDTTINDNNIKLCSTESAEPGCGQLNTLNRISSSGKFGFTGESTKFYRIINILEVEDDQEIQITVKVGWLTDNGVLKEVESRENLLRWPPIYDEI